MSTANKRIAALALSIIVALTVLLSACGGSDESGYVFIDEDATATQVALTQIALAHPSATPGPSPTPTATSTPYYRPTDPPDYDGERVITRVGADEITLDEYRQRVRFDRYRLLYPIVKLAEKYGTEQLFDLTRDENQYLASLFSTLADSYSFGKQSHRLMVIGSIVEQEARRRGMEVDPFKFDSLTAQWLGLHVGKDGQLPPEFQARYDEFIQGIETYAGMSEEQFRRIIRAQAYYEQLKFLVGQEAPIDTEHEAIVGVKVQDIIVESEDEAQQIAQRLAAGEPLSTVAEDLGYDTRNADEERTLRRSDPNLPDALLRTIFNADPGTIIGPTLIPQGWYVGRVGQSVLDVLGPKDIDKLREAYFLNWIEARMDDPEYVEDYGDWVDYTPQEPLPRDISPLMHDENFTLPEVTPLPFEEGVYDEMTPPAE